jgi:hypothetical protein
VRFVAMTRRALVRGAAGCAIALLQSVSHPGWAEVRNIDYGTREIEQATGRGQDLAAARSAAMADAIRQAAQILMHTEVERQAFARHGELLANPALIRASELVDKYRQGGDTVVVCKVTVNLAALQEAMQTAAVIQAASAVLADREDGSPRVMAIAKAGMPGSDAEVPRWSVDRVNNFLQSHGVEFVDRQEIERLVSEDAQILHQPQPELALAKKAAAEVFVSVQTNLTEGVSSGAWRSVKATVTLQATDASSGLTLASVVGESRELALRGNVATSRKAAIEEAVGGVSERLYTELMTRWKQEIVDGRHYVVRVRGNGDRQALIKTLQSLGATVQPNGNDHAIVYKGPLSAVRRALKKQGYTIVRVEQTLLEVAIN